MEYPSIERAKKAGVYSAFGLFHLVLTILA